MTFFSVFINSRHIESIEINYGLVRHNYNKMRLLQKELAAACDHELQKKCIEGCRNTKWTGETIKVRRYHFPSLGGTHKTDHQVLETNRHRQMETGAISAGCQSFNFQSVRMAMQNY